MCKFTENWNFTVQTSAIKKGQYENKFLSKLPVFIVCEHFFCCQHFFNFTVDIRNIASNSILIKFGDIELYSSLPWKTKFRYLSLSLLHIRAIEAGKEIPILVFRGSLIFSGARRKFDFSFVVKFDMRTFCFFFFNWICVKFRIILFPI